MKVIAVHKNAIVKSCDTLRINIDVVLQTESGLCLVVPEHFVFYILNCGHDVVTSQAAFIQPGNHIAWIEGDMLME